MATPHVAGAAALLIQMHPDWTAAQIKAALIETGGDVQLYDSNIPRVYAQGGGVINCLSSINAKSVIVPGNLSSDADVNSCQSVWVSTIALTQTDFSGSRSFSYAESISNPTGVSWSMTWGLASGANTDATTDQMLAR